MYNEMTPQERARKIADTLALMFDTQAEALEYAEGMIAEFLEAHEERALWGMVADQISGLSGARTD